MNFYTENYQTKNEFYDAWSKQDHTDLEMEDFLAFKMWKSFFARHTPIEAAERLFKAFPSAGEARLKRSNEVPYAALHGVMRNLVTWGVWCKTNSSEINPAFKEYANEVFNVITESISDRLTDKRLGLPQPPKYYTYTWIRKDLDPVHQIIQAGHAIQIRSRSHSAQVHTAEKVLSRSKGLLIGKPHDETYSRLVKLNKRIVREAEEAHAIGKYAQTDHFVLFEVENEKAMNDLWRELRQHFTHGTMSRFDETTTPGAIGFNAISIGPLRQTDPRRQLLAKYKLYGTSMTVTELLGEPA